MLPETGVKQYKRIFTNVDGHKIPHTTMLSNIKELDGL